MFIPILFLWNILFWFKYSLQAVLRATLFFHTCFSLSKMERDHSQAINEHKTIVKQLNKKTDASLDAMKQQHSAAITKVSVRLVYVHEV